MEDENHPSCSTPRGMEQSKAPKKPSGIGEVAVNVGATASFSSSESCRLLLPPAWLPIAGDRGFGLLISSSGHSRSHERDERGLSTRDGLSLAAWAAATAAA